MTRKPPPRPAKPCLHCGTVKPLEEFYDNARAKDGRQPYCKECNKAKAREWYCKNRAEKEKLDPFAALAEKVAVLAARVDQLSRQVDALALRAKASRGPRWKKEK